MPTLRTLTIRAVSLAAPARDWAFDLQTPGRNREVSYFAAVVLLSLALALPPRSVHAGECPSDRFDSAFSLIVFFDQTLEFVDDIFDVEECADGTTIYLAAATVQAINNLAAEIRHDPEITYTLEVQNPFDETLAFGLNIGAPIVALDAEAQASASLEVTITDGGADGVLVEVRNGVFGILAPVVATALQGGFPIPPEPTGVDVGTSLDVVGTTSFSAGPVPAPAPPPGETWNAFGLTTGFTLSPGDSATLVGRVTIVPESAAASVLMAATAVLATVFRLRRRPPAAR